MIPKLMHFVWVGDESKQPNNCIETWRRLNPTWTVRVWTNDDLAEYGWINARHMVAMADHELCGVADLMRWEILYNEGGLAIDADSWCVRPLDDWLLEAEAFACWENEIALPRMISNGYVASIPKNEFFGQIIKDLHATDSVVGGRAWENTGPLCLTKAVHRYRYTGLTILPSHMFIPVHHTGLRYTGNGVVYAHQEWASTHHSYDELHSRKAA